VKLVLNSPQLAQVLAVYQQQMQLPMYVFFPSVFLQYCYCIPVLFSISHLEPAPV